MRSACWRDSVPIMRDEGSLPRHGPWLALGTALAIAVLPFTACPAIDGWRHARRLAEVQPQLAYCLAGEGALDDATLRERAITAEVERSDWPARCLPMTAELEATLKAAYDLAADCEGQCCVGDDDCASIEHRRHLLSLLREQLDSHRFADGVAVAMLDGVVAEGEMAPPAASKAGPGPVVMPGGYDASAMQPPHLLMHRRGFGARLCEVAPKMVSCHPLPASVPTGGDVLLVDGAPRFPVHLLVRPDDPAPLGWTVYDATGVAKLELRHGPIGVAVTDEGPRALVVDHGQTFIVTPDDEPRAWSHDTAHGPPLVWESHVYAVGENGGALVLRRHGLDGAVEAEVPLPLPDTAVALTACGETTVLAAVDDGVDDGGVIVFDTGGTLHAHPVALPARWAGLTCEGSGRASLTWTEEGRLSSGPAGLTGPHHVHRIRCTPSGCAPTATATFDITRREKASRYFAASLGERIAFVWESGLGDVRAHVAPMDAEGQPFVVATEGLSWRTRPIDLLAGRGWALLLAHGPTGTHAFYLDEAGAHPVVQGQ